MAVDQRQSSKFFLNVNIALVSQFFIFGLAFLFRIVLARGLGDEGLGTYTLFYLTVLVAGAVSNLGVGLGNLYFVNKEGYDLKVLLNNSLFTIGAMGVVGAVAIVAYGLATDTGAFVTGRAYWLYAPTIPAVAAYLIVTSFLQGKSRFVALAGVALVQGVSALLIAAVLFFTDALNVFGAIFAWTGSFVLADAVAVALVGVHHISLSAVLRPRWRVLWEQIRYGAKGQLANLAQLFNYRFDQFVLALFVARAGVGHYSVAVSVSESAWWISGAVSTVLVPSLTRMGKSRGGGSDADRLPEYPSREHSYGECSGRSIASGHSGVFRVGVRPGYRAAYDSHAGRSCDKRGPCTKQLYVQSGAGDLQHLHYPCSLRSHDHIGFCLYPLAWCYGSRHSLVHRLRHFDGGRDLLVQAFLPSKCVGACHS